MKKKLFFVDRCLCSSTVGVGSLHDDASHRHRESISQ